jgi:hypothetical protein
MKFADICTYLMTYNRFGLCSESYQLLDPQQKYLKKQKTASVTVMPHVKQCIESDGYNILHNLAHYNEDVQEAVMRLISPCLLGQLTHQKTTNAPTELDLDRWRHMKPFKMAYWANKETHKALPSQEAFTKRVTRYAGFMVLFYYFEHKCKVGELDARCQRKLVDFEKIVDYLSTVDKVEPSAFRDFLKKKTTNFRDRLHKINNEYMLYKDALGKLSADELSQASKQFATFRQRTDLSGHAKTVMKQLSTLSKARDEKMILDSKYGSINKVGPLPHSSKYQL